VKNEKAQTQLQSNIPLRRGNNGENEINEKRRIDKMRMGWKITAIILVGFMSCTFLYWNWRAFQGDAYYRKAQELRKEVYYDDAVEKYKMAIAMDPEMAVYHKELGELFSVMAIFRKDQANDLRQKAIAELQRAIKLNPYDGFTLVSLGSVLTQDGKIELAESTYLKAIELDPTNAYFHINLGIFYKNQGRYVEAENELQKVLAIFPNNRQAIRLLKEMGVQNEDF